jgi:hypothetical protein
MQPTSDRCHAIRDPRHGRRLQGTRLPKAGTDGNPLKSLFAELPGNSGILIMVIESR